MQSGSLNLIYQLGQTLTRKIFAKICGFSIKFNSGEEYLTPEINFQKHTLEFPEPEFHLLHETYVLIRKLTFQPVLKLNIVEDFKSLLRWRSAEFTNILILRNYPLTFMAEINNLPAEEICLKKRLEVKKIEHSAINLVYKLRIHEEIIKVLPYLRTAKQQTLCKVPITKRPCYKSYFSREEMRQFQEELAVQNDTGRANVEISEIYDRFFANFYSGIRQVSGSRELECMPAYANIDKFPEKSYFLILGKLRHSNKPVKALVLLKK